MSKSLAYRLAGLAIAAIPVFATGARASSAVAASPATEAYLHNVGVNLAFLRESSRMAGPRAQSAAIKTLAEDEADNLPAASGEARLAANGEGLPQGLPMTAAAGLAADEASGEMQTGRSAYSPDHPAAPSDAGAVASTAALGFGILSSAKGETFDALYRSTHVNSLKQLADLYYSYSVTGDDVSLRAAARRDLPMIKALLDEARQTPTQ